ncbi:MAG: hypothetical protein HY855_13565 [Burkholderiales bacterium]|nr:hypothetical protein [Burkholderiales bacterium]
MQTPAPRHFLSGPANGLAFHAIGMPQERAAREAARRAFVEMKQRFIDAVAEVEGTRGHWLRHQVRQTQEPVDLWLLRGAVYAALGGHDPDTLRLRLDLHRALDSVFPDSGELTPFLPLA